jgi:flagellar biogenesis protein FliO
MFTTLLLATLVLSTAPEAAGDLTPPPPPPVLPSAADSIVAAAFDTPIGTAASGLKVPVVSEAASASLVAPLLALLALGAIAYTVTRKKRSFGVSIRVVESCAIGPKRSLVLAEVMGDRILLGVSESGISVLSAKPAPEPVIEAHAFVMPSSPVIKQTSSMSFVDRLRGRCPTAQNFDALLGESVEDQELRAKLASGFRSVIP